MTEDIICPSCGKKINLSVDYSRVGGMCDPEGTTKSDTPPEVCPFCGQKL